MARVSLPIVILLGCGITGILWWYWTRDIDFMKPPGELQLARIRHDTAASFSKRPPVFTAEIGEDESRIFQSPIKAPPVITPGDPHAPAELDAYREHAEEGAAALAELAVHLEEQSGNARALLAWERVLDVCRPDAGQRAAALSGIQRLHPAVAPWSIDPAAAIPLVLDATVTGPAPPEGLEALLAGCASYLGKHSAGLLRFESRLGKPAKVDPAAPPVLSLQILAEGDSAASTGLIDLELSASPEQARREILGAAYKLVASQLAAVSDLAPPDPLAEEDDPEAALATRITRLSWAEFGKSLQPADPP